MFQITANIKQLKHVLTDRARNQLPFAAAMAITQTAKDAQEEEGR